MLKKIAVRFIHNGKSRTYIVNAPTSIDGIIQALDLLECDVPEIVDAIGLAMIAKTYPEGAHLADEGDGPVIDTTRNLRPLPPREAEQVAAAC